MPLITWNESLSVGVKQIDEQHKKLVSMLNRLYDAAQESVSDDLLTELMKELTDYTIYHFGTEEKYFDEFKYKFADLHKKQHAFFVKKLQDFKKKLDKKQATLSLELTQFLTDWIMDHIANTDKKFKKCFNEHGLF